MIKIKIKDWIWIVVAVNIEECEWIVPTVVVCDGFSNVLSLNLHGSWFVWITFVERIVWHIKCIKCDAPHGYVIMERIFQNFKNVRLVSQHHNGLHEFSRPIKYLIILENKSPVRSTYNSKINLWNHQFESNNYLQTFAWYRIFPNK